jgi:acetyl-CoA acetyltransferase
MSQPRKPTRTRRTRDAQDPGRRRHASATTADGLAAQRTAFAERERRTAQAMTAARRLSDAAEPRP